MAIKKNLNDSSACNDHVRYKSEAKINGSQAAGRRCPNIKMEMQEWARFGIYPQITRNIMRTKWNSQPRFLKMIKGKASSLSP